MQAPFFLLFLVPLFPDLCSLFPYHFTHTSAATNPKNTSAITPFMVKNAAFSRRKSFGDTSECS